MGYNKSLRYSRHDGSTCVIDNKHLKSLGSVLGDVRRKKELIRESEFDPIKDIANQYMVTEDPFRGPGKNVRITLFKEIRRVQPDTLKLVCNWSGKEFLRETWTRFISEEFPITTDQEIMDLWFELQLRPMQPNRCYKFLMQYALGADADYVPHDVIRAQDPYYVGPHNVERISLSRQGVAFPLTCLQAVYNESFETFFEDNLWPYFHRPLVYVGTTSGEVEEIMIEVALIFKIKEFAPDVPLFTGPAY
ncbi:PxORF4 peptide [Plutella xylostella granulovirus]|uniref:Granulin n=1 Tax=Plutella xylostella granulovirus TaxID=98383 RepID=Q9JGU6_9BBAC|nr:PxORF4 peptide [Plutella xylostella granulovirus]AAG27302.1 PxORF4 peptide [Plutella xylostella granulovirus]AIN44205.1 granulin [Plutella xylostella granulovirus]AMQ35616.1 PxGV-Corf4 protein [Plutella xylostella granulovirus]AMQ35733.1 PxGV-Korf4 protein [Plutella xylostella granulovirus]AMQ35850.1 PxGV-Morf4 protein [Plutella xylostella granulovirus]